MTENMYRVFNKKGDYQQSYSLKLKDSLDWAIDCAKRTNGDVYLCEIEGGATQNKTKVYPLKQKP